MPTFTLKVTLQGIRPPIWRRFVVPAGISLAQLHRVLQIVMGWTDSHLHQFERGRVIYGVPDPELGLPVEDERRTRLDAVLQREADWMTYEYDFGDSWSHRLVLEKVTQAEAARFAVIVTGKRACPPEDCGGVWGYERIVAASEDRNHPEHLEVRDWLGGDFDAAAFDLAAVAAALRGLPLREIKPRARRQSFVERLLAGSDEPSPAFRATLKTKLEDPAAILTDREVRYLSGQVELALADVPLPSRAEIPSAEDMVRWSAVAARCKQVRDERGWTTHDAATALKVPQHKIDAVEKGPVRGYELEVAARYFRLLGLEAWIARWARSNPALARRQGLGR